MQSVQLLCKQCANRLIGNDYYHFGTKSWLFFLKFLNGSLFINLMQVYKIYSTLPNKSAMKNKIQKNKACQICSCQSASYQDIKEFNNVFKI